MPLVSIYPIYNPQHSKPNPIPLLPAIGKSLVEYSKSRKPDYVEGKIPIDDNDNVLYCANSSIPDKFLLGANPMNKLKGRNFFSQGIDVGTRKEMNKIFQTNEALKRGDMFTASFLAGKPTAYPFIFGNTQSAKKETKDQSTNTESNIVSKAVQTNLEMLPHTTSGGYGSSDSNDDDDDDDDYYEAKELPVIDNLAVTTVMEETKQINHTPRNFDRTIDNFTKHSIRELADQDELHVTNFINLIFNLTGDTDLTISNSYVGKSMIEWLRISLRLNNTAPELFINKLKSFNSKNYRLDILNQVVSLYNDKDEGYDESVRFLHKLKGSPDLTDNNIGFHTSAPIAPPNQKAAPPPLPKNPPNPLSNRKAAPPPLPKNPPNPLSNRKTAPSFPQDYLINPLSSNLLADQLKAQKNKLNPKMLELGLALETKNQSRLRTGIQDQNKQNNITELGQALRALRRQVQPDDDENEDQEFEGSGVRVGSKRRATPRKKPSLVKRRKR